MWGTAGLPPSPFRLVLHPRLVFSLCFSTITDYGSSKKYRVLTYTILLCVRILYAQYKFTDERIHRHMYYVLVRLPVNTFVRAYERTKFELIYSELSKLFKFHKGHFLEKQIQLFCLVTDDNGFKAELHIFTKFKVFKHRYRAAQTFVL